MKMPMTLDQAIQLDTSYLDLPEVMYARVAPVPVAQPRLVLFNHAFADELGLDVASLSEQDLADCFAGNRLPDTATPLAQAYAGHQFGHFTMLGDGRAHLIGEHLALDRRRVDIQLKGSGPTPYARRGDGRAALGPMLREYLIAEAMAALNIPTARALAVVATGEAVRRETPLPGAILTRVAESHLRVGTFEFAALQQDLGLVKTLLDYAIDRHAPEVKGADNQPLAFLEAVMHKQADLIVHWMRVGFIHGVMNTDNTAISGQTIDYGPCAFMDAYDPATVFSSIDHAGRYAFANQPSIVLWNLTKLAESLLPLIDDEPQRAVELAEATLNTFADDYRSKWLSMMRNKLGLTAEEADDLTLVADLLTWMQDKQADYTNTFRDLGDALTQGKPDDELYQCGDFDAWHQRWIDRQERDGQSLEDAQRLMQKTNPAAIPRNQMVEAALDAATQGDLAPFRAMLDALGAPYDDRAALKPYQSPPPADAPAYQTFCGT